MLLFAELRLPLRVLALALRVLALALRVLALALRVLALALRVCIVSLALARLFVTAASWLSVANEMLTVEVNRSDWAATTVRVCVPSGIEDALSG